MKNNISGVVILYNPDDSVIDNIKTYYSSLERLYIWCNSSISSSIRNYINELFGDKIIWCGNQINAGMGAALNAVLRMSDSDNTKWLLTMDQDSSFSKNSIDVIMTYVESLEAQDESNVAIVAANHILNGSMAHHKTDETNWVMMSGNLINIEIANTCGAFNPDLFIDAVDIEFCRRVLHRGYKIKVCLDGTLKHQLGDISEVSIFGYKTRTSNHNSVRLYYIYRNYLYMITFMSGMYGIRFYIIKFLVHKLLCVIFAETDKLNKLKMISLGCYHFILKRLGPMPRK